MLWQEISVVMATMLIMPSYYALHHFNREYVMDIFKADLTVKYQIRSRGWD